MFSEKAVESKSLSVLIPDGENYLTKAVVNGLAQVRGIKVHLMSNRKADPMRYSRYVHGYSYYANTGSEFDWIANINKEIEKHDISVVMPVWEVGVKTLITHRDRIARKSAIALLPSLDAFNTAVNKGLLARHMEGNDVPYPKGVLVESADDIGKAAHLAFPVLIKPLEGFGGGHGIRKFKGRQDLDAYLANEPTYYPYIFQEYVEGYDIDCSVLCRDGEILAYTIQKGNLASKREFGPPTGLDFLFEKELFTVVEKLMKSLDWNGVAHIDLRYDKNDSRFKVIEVNARYWGSLDASILAGVNFPYLHCLASLNKAFNMPAYRFIKYLSSEGLTQMARKNILFLFRLGFVFNNTPLKFALKDPWPMMYKLFINSGQD